MSDPKTPPVAHGDRRREVWIEDDPAQLTKVRHTWPETDVTDVAVTPEEPSAWEAVEDDD